MKVSLNLIKQLTKTKLGNDELVKRINSRLAEVEDVVKLADKYEGILVAEIKKAEAHPDADKLGVYQIYNGKDVIQVVAGDKTLKVGDKVAHIAPGLTVPETAGTDKPFVLKKVKLRGQESNGMLGSAKELDFGDDHESVLKLDTDKPAGTTLIDAYDLDDLIIEVENKTLTHRPDCFGLIGFAREVAGIQDVVFSSPKWLQEEMKQPKNDGSLKLSVKNEVKDVCPTYYAVAIKAVELKDSPVQLMSYLARVGVRPINNIVDMTNYLMVMTGQPLHAFDYDKLNGGEIIIRYPKKGEKLTLLDGKEIEIHPSAITICDSKGPIALGGVMGGGNSEISAGTKNIIIESANFDMYSIRRTSMKHGLFTDAATRFMRGQSPQLSGRVLSEAIRHTQDLGGGTVASGIIGHEPKVEQKNVTVDYGKVNSLLGIEMSADEQRRRLKNVEIDSSGGKVEVPFWRGDLNIWQDIAEEVGRLSGFDNIPATVPSRSLKAVDLSELEKLKIELRNILAAAGANELLTYSGISKDLLTKTEVSNKDLYQIRNAISPELEYMRGALLPSLLNKVHANHRRGVSEFAIYSIGKTHSKKDIEKGLPTEHERLGLVFSADDKLAEAKYAGAAYYQARTYLDYIFTVLGVSNVDYSPLGRPDWLEATGPLSEKHSALVKADKKTIGVVGEFKGSVRRNLKLRSFSAGFEVDLNALIECISNRPVYRRLSKFPGSNQDVTFVTPQEVTYKQLWSVFTKSLHAKGVRYIVSGVGAYRKQDDSSTRNITFRVNIEPTEKTMSIEELTKLVDDAVNKTSKELKIRRV